MAIESITFEECDRQVGQKSGVSNLQIEGMRPPTAEEMARDAATREPRTLAIGSTPEGARNPLWSAEEFNGTWFFCCLPAAFATIKQTNEGDDVVKMDFMCCLVLKAQNEYARIGNSNRFLSTFYLPDSEERSDEVMNFTSPTFVRREKAPAFAWKTGQHPVEDVAMPSIPAASNSGGGATASTFQRGELDIIRQSSTTGKATVSVPLEDIPSTTVKELKSLIFAQETSAKDPVDGLQDVFLIFAGKVLEDDNKTLGEYGIKERGQSIRFIPKHA